MKYTIIGLVLALALFVSACSGQTTTASNVTNTSATLNAQVSWNKDEGPGEHWYEYKTSNALTWNRQRIVRFQRWITPALLPVVLT